MITPITIIIIGLMMLKGNEADRNADYTFVVHLNTTKFDPNNNPTLKFGEDEFKAKIRDGFFDYHKNRDRTMVLWGMYVRAHCRSQDECWGCLNSTAALMDDCCVHSYGVDARSDFCEARYETYLFG
ncbi:hypothetical protein LINPERHAP2_LOCUS36842 [Linum perenne]